MPRALHLSEAHGRWLFILEDLDAAGFCARRSRLSEGETRSCLAWLARFHATFLGQKPARLWTTGTYWHLSTRPEELAALTDARLRRAAPRIDRELTGARFQTLVHGDPKVENFCFGPAGVAAVDFQYVGGGVGVKDVAYFLSSCLTPSECAASADHYLEVYFGALEAALAGSNHDVNAIVSEWREMFPLAWVDFYRFLLGWAPEGDYKDPYSDHLKERVLRKFDGSLR